MFIAPCVTKRPSIHQMVKSEVYKPNTFLYFAYGANLLTFRVCMYTPSAEFVSIARAENYRLDFIRYNKFWGGPEATLVSTANAHVWGVIWRIKTEEKGSLDGMLEVDIKRYYVKHIPVLTPYMGYFNCRVYIQKINPLPKGDNDPIPVNLWPSLSYKQVMIMGAIEHDLPPFYIEYLKNIKDNGEESYFRVLCLLMRYARDPPCECRVPGRIPRKPLKLELNKAKPDQKHPATPTKPKVKKVIAF